MRGSNAILLCIDFGTCASSVALARPNAPGRPELADLSMERTDTTVASFFAVPKRGRPDKRAVFAEMAQALEKIALEDEYFIEKRLYPNVDFYSGIMLKAMGIPTELMTVIFATGRTPGWIAHWNEMVSAPYKIGRPRQLYNGPGKRDYVALANR